MGGRTRIEERLALFRREFPRHVSWAEVRPEDPTVFRNAVIGGSLVVPAVGATVGLSGLMLEIPAPVVLPQWIDWARGLLLVVLMFVTIGLWLVAGVAVSLPADLRRQLALRAFGRERGLLFSRMGLAPTSGGVLLAGGDERARPSRARVDSAKAAYRAEFALWCPEPTGRPSLQIAIARHSGNRSDPQAPRHSFRYLETLLPREVPHIVIDARRNGRLRSILPGTQRLSLEGDFDRYFTVYVPNGYERDALQLLTPDVWPASSITAERGTSRSSMIGSSSPPGDSDAGRIAASARRFWPSPNSSSRSSVIRRGTIRTPGPGVPARRSPRPVAACVAARQLGASPRPSRSGRRSSHSPGCSGGSSIAEKRPGARPVVRNGSDPDRQQRAESCRSAEDAGSGDHVEGQVPGHPRADRPSPCSRTAGPVHEDGSDTGSWRDFSVSMGCSPCASR